MQLKPHQKALLGAAALVAILPAIPFGALAMLPLTYLNTHLHELAHAFAALVSGGAVGDIQVFANGSGVANVAGGNILLIGSAGYMGAALLGAALVYYARNAKNAQNALRILAIALGVAMVLFVRGDLVGILTGAFWVGAFALASSKLQGPQAIFAAQFVGVAQCLNSLQSVYTVFHISRASDSHSDARILEQATGLPAPLWAGLWVLASVGLLGFAVVRSWSDPTR